MTDPTIPARVEALMQHWCFNGLIYTAEARRELTRLVTAEQEKAEAVSELVVARNRVLCQLVTIDTLERELARWKICSNCGQAMSAPGICDEAVSERERGQEVMLEEQLARAEKAEALLKEALYREACLRQELAAAGVWTNRSTKKAEPPPTEPVR